MLPRARLMKAPTLADVAREAGVSVTTVSRVLNNRGYLSEQTRQAVADAMARLSYTPNAVARSLRDSSSRLVGIIFPSVAHPFYGQMASELEVRLSRAGYRVLLCNSEGEEATEREYLSMLLGHQVDGIVTGAHSNSVAETPNLRAPLVTIDRAVAGPYTNVRCDDAAATSEATRGLLARGATRLVHLTSTTRDESQRTAGFSAACREAGCHSRIAHVVRGPGFSEDHSAVERALDEAMADGGVDGIVASNDYLAMSALEWARGRGLRVPEAIQVIGFDGARSTRMLVPALSTVVQPYAHMAEAAVNLITDSVSLADHPAASPGEEDRPEGSVWQFPGEMYWGGTTRAL